MIDWLRTDSMPRPRLVAGTARELADGEGAILPPFPRGSLILEDAAGELLRLSWEDRADSTGAVAVENQPQPGPVEKLDPLHRALPAGDYTLVGYRMIQKDVGGDLWYACATGESIASFTVTDGEALLPEIDPKVTVELLRAELVDGAVQLGMAVHGAGGAGLTLYKNSKRIPIAYSVTTKKRKELVRSNMTYG